MEDQAKQERAELEQLVERIMRLPGDVRHGIVAGVVRIVVDLAELVEQDQAAVASGSPAA